MKTKFFITLTAGVAGAIALPVQHTLGVWLCAISLVVGVNIIWLLLFSSSGLRNPSWRTRAERRACQDQIADMCDHGPVFEVVDQPHTYAGINGKRFKIVDGRRVVEVSR